MPLLGKTGTVPFWSSSIQQYVTIINSLKGGNNSSKIKDQNISDDLYNWSKLKNSKSSSRRFSADDVPHVKLSNRFSLLDIDQQSTGFLKHMENKVKPLAGKKKFRK